MVWALLTPWGCYFVVVVALIHVCVTLKTNLSCSFIQSHWPRLGKPQPLLFHFKTHLFVSALPSSSPAFTAPSACTDPHQCPPEWALTTHLLLGLLAASCRLGVRLSLLSCRWAHTHTPHYIHTSASWLWGSMPLPGIPLIKEYLGNPRVNPTNRSYLCLSSMSYCQHTLPDRLLPAALSWEESLSEPMYYHEGPQRLSLAVKRLGSPPCSGSYPHCDLRHVT